MLRDRRLLALLVAETISTTGAQMTWLALPWFVLTTTGSATRTSIVLVAEIVGLALLGLPGGAMLARVGARRTMIVCDSVRAPVVALIPVLYWAGPLSFPVLPMVAFGLGAATAPYFAAQKVIVPELLGEDEQLVTKANALLQAATRTTLLAGPVLAGVLIGVIGATSVLLVDAATYVVSALLVAVFVPQREPVEERREDRDIRRGLRFIVRDPLLRVWTFAFAFGDAAWTAFFVAVPVLVISRFGYDPKIAGWLFASFGVGAVVGNVFSYRVLARRFDGLGIFATCIVVQVLPLWMLWLPLSAAGFSVALLLSGIGNGLVNPSLHAIMTLRIPERIRPTVMTTKMVVWALINPLGLVIAGPVLDAFGTTPVLVGFAAIQTLTMGLAALAAVRERGRRLSPVVAAG
ncbi:MAG: MFS transporter [Chloroflexota bacterium]